MRDRISPRWLARIASLVSPICIAASASAQTSTGTIRGVVSGQDGVPVAEAQVAAKNVETGVQRGTTTRSDGSYVLPGLVPATYDLTVRRIGMGAQTRRVVVQIGAVSIQDFSLTQAAQQFVFDSMLLPGRAGRKNPVEQSLFVGYSKC